MPDKTLVFDPPNRDSGESIGSLLIHGDAERDEYGHPFQVLLRCVDDRVIALVVDDRGGRSLGRMITTRNSFAPMTVDPSFNGFRLT